MDFDFDTSVNRLDSHSVKYAGRLAKFGDAEVFPAWVADMDFATAPCVREAVAERAQHPIYGYTVVPDSLYETVIDWHREQHGWAIERESIVLTPGTLPALSAVIEALTATDDGVLIQPPVYGPFASITHGSGRTLVANPLVEHDGHYQMDREHLWHCMAKGARLLLLCNPHNPVGRVWSRSDLESVLEMARIHDCAVLSDDIHADLTYADNRFVPLGSLAQQGDRVISAVSPCKTFNLQGLALTALVIPDPATRKAIRAVIGQRHLSNFNPFSLTAAEAAWRDGATWHDALVSYLQDTRDAVTSFVHERLAPIRVTPPQAGYLMWLDCRAWDMTDTELRDFFIRDCRLGLSPGTDFGDGGSAHMRLNIGAPRTQILAALQAVEAAMRTRELCP